MPVQSCTEGGRPGFRWGETGRCYPYTAGNEASRKRARAKAEAQGRAIEANTDAALIREVEATGWYLGHQGLMVGRGACSVCGPTLVRADNLTLLRELTRDAKGRRIPRQPQPRALEARYRRQLQARMRKINTIMVEAMNAALVPLEGEINERARADAAPVLAWAGSVSAADLDDLIPVLRFDTQASDMAALLRVVARVERAIKAAAAVSIAQLESLSEAVRNFTTRGVTSQILTVAGIDVLPTLGTASNILSKWAQDNAALIRSLDARYFDDIRDAVTATVAEGKSTATLSKLMQERFGVTKSRADLIATDQVGTLNAKITQERQTTLGIEEYTWDNSGDSRVRPLHRDTPEGIGNTVRRWDTPHPTEGHPGEPVRCRCSAIPVIG